MKEADRSIRDYKTSLELYREAYQVIPEADSHWKGLAIYNEGLAYYMGLGVDQDFQKAYDCFFRATELDASFCIMLGDYFCFGVLGKRDFPLALSFYKRAAKEGHNNLVWGSLSMVEYNLKHIKEGTFNEQAFEEYKKGVLAESQSDAPNREEEALKYLKLAADMGYAPAEVDYATSYFGSKVSVDMQIRENIERYLKDGISQNYAPALNQYGYWLQYGKQIPLSWNAITYDRIEEAYPYYKKAADMNFALGLTAVGNYYYRGLAPVGNPDFSKAYEYYSLAAIQGSKEAIDGAKMAEARIGTTAVAERERVERYQRTYANDEPLLTSLLKAAVTIMQGKEDIKAMRNGTYGNQANSQQVNTQLNTFSNTFSGSEKSQKDETVYNERVRRYTREENNAKNWISQYTKDNAWLKANNNKGVDPIRFKQYGDSKVNDLKMLRYCRKQLETIRAEALSLGGKSIPMGSVEMEVIQILKSDN